MNREELLAADARLIQIVDNAWAEARRRAGPRLVCQAGCGQCCHGAFPINILDAWRLERGIRSLQMEQPDLAARIVERARKTAKLFLADFPGDTETGVLGKDRQARAAFFERTATVPCPALGHESGVCEIYEYRPVTCRAAGPPVSFGGEPLPHCGLCLEGATEEEIEAARVEVDPESSEVSLLAEHGLAQTLIAFPLARGVYTEPASDAS